MKSCGLPLAVLVHLFGRVSGFLGGWNGVSGAKCVALPRCRIIMSTEPSSPLSRGDALRSAVTALVGSAACASMTRAEAPNTISACPNEGNCLSTASFKQVSIGKYRAPWSFKEDTADAKEAFNKLAATVKADPQLKVLEVDDEGLYLKASGPSAVPPDGLDILEFLLRPSDSLVTFRSQSRSVVNAGPIVVGDGGSQKNRLENIRRKLGWPEQGIDDYYSEKKGFKSSRGGYLNEFSLKGTSSSYGEDEEE